MQSDVAVIEVWVSRCFVLPAPYGSLLVCGEAPPPFLMPSLYVRELTS